MLLLSFQLPAATAGQTPGEAARRRWQPQHDTNQHHV